MHLKQTYMESIIYIFVNIIKHYLHICKYYQALTKQHNLLNIEI